MLTALELTLRANAEKTFKQKQNRKRRTSNFPRLKKICPKVHTSGPGWSAASPLALAAAGGGAGQSLSCIDAPPTSSYWPPRDFCLPSFRRLRTGLGRLGFSGFFPLSVCGRQTARDAPRARKPSSSHKTPLL